MRRLTLALLAGLTLGAPHLATAQTHANLLTVGAGQATRVALSAPVRDLVVGDPNVADVSVINERTLIVLGKKAGATSLLAFDARGQALVERQIVVSSIPDQAVVFQRGSKTVAYACGDNCSPIASDAKDDDKGDK